MDELPRVAHPTAKAFFDALDQYNECRERRNLDDVIDDNKDGDIGNFPATSKVSPSMSSSLKRKSQSLGWRNRHSQNEYYPVTVLQSPIPLKTKEEFTSTSNEHQSDCRLRSRSFSVLQVQRGEVDGTYGTGATVWPAALVLIKYLERTNSHGFRRNDESVGDNTKTDQHLNNDFLVSLQGKHVIDLGAGTGVTSIAAALLGAKSVVCTDGEESVVGLARSNIQRASDQLSVSRCSSGSKLPNQGCQTKPKTEVENPSFCDTREETISPIVNCNNSDMGSTVTIDDCTVRAQKYWWGDATYRDLASFTGEKGLAILVADCVLPKLYPIAPLVQAIDECLREHDGNIKKDNQQNISSARSSSYAILSYEHRYYPEYDPRTQFRRLASARCLDVCVVPRDEMDPVYSLDDVEIWIVRRCHDDKFSAN